MIEDRSRARRERLLPAALLLLSLIPIGAGAVRLFQLGSNPELTPDNARFLADPIPAVLHIVGVTLFCVLGAFQFSPQLRTRSAFHRIAGRIAGPAGIVGAAAGMYMSVFYRRPDLHGWALPALRLVFGAIMLLSLVRGLTLIWRRDIARHRAWMMRAYAVGSAAGTQSLLLVPCVVLGGLPSEALETTLMGAAWLLNLAVAEWLVRAPAARSRPNPLVRSVPLQA